MARIKLVKHVDDLMKKRAIQAEFLDQQGLEVLASWIEENPDKSYPLPQVVELTFDILERLSIESSHLENSRLPKVVQLYAHGATQMKYLESRALSII